MEATSGISHLLTPIAWDITAFLKALRDPTGVRLCFHDVTRLICEVANVSRLIYTPITNRLLLFSSHTRRTSLNENENERDNILQGFTFTGVPATNPPKARPRDSKRLRARHHSLLLPVAKAMAHHGGAGAFSTSGVQTPQIRKVWELLVWLLPVSFQTGTEHSCHDQWSCINIA